MKLRKCAVCQREVEHYVPIEEKYRKNSIAKRPEFINKEEYSCPYCYASDRDRLIISFLARIHSRLKEGIDFLEIAPAGALKRYLYEYWGECNLYTADLYMNDVDYSVDIQNMKSIPDETFDFIVCSHVLEHVENDQRAMKELCRVLRKDGLGIIIVPLDLDREITDEQWGCSPTENLRRFGQEDHVRAYSKADYIDRLQRSGFGVHQLGKEFFGETVFEENALIDSSTIYLVYKERRLYEAKELVIENFCKRNDLDKLCNYWIDVCDLHEGQLRIWGWAYFINRNSALTKIKILLRGSVTYTFGADLRERPDIQNLFGGVQTDYRFSGIDFLRKIEDIVPGDYQVCITLFTRDKHIQIVANSDLYIG